jgi:hypothetical protein
MTNAKIPRGIQAPSFVLARTGFAVGMAGVDVVTDAMHSS